MKDSIILKNNLKEIRTSKKISQLELANLVGTTRQTIIAIEKEQFNPSTKLAFLLSLALKTNIEKIFYLELSKNS